MVAGKSCKKKLMLAKSKQRIIHTSRGKDYLTGGAAAFLFNCGWSEMCCWVTGADNVQRNNRKNLWEQTLLKESSLFTAFLMAADQAAMSSEYVEGLWSKLIQQYRVPAFFNRHDCFKHALVDIFCCFSMKSTITIYIQNE